jgi:hypothetical protein
MRFFISLLLAAIVMFFIFSNSKLVAQVQQLSFDLAYPVPVSDTFYSNYDGIIALDLNYKHSISPLFNINGQIGYSRSNVSFDRFPDEGRSTTHAGIFRFIIGPSIDLNLTNQISFIPEVGIGYAHVRFTNDDVEDISEGGINTTGKFSIEYQFSQNFGLGIFSSYHFIYLGEPNNSLDIRFNREMHSINTGIKIVYSL